MISILYNFRLLEMGKAVMDWEDFTEKNDI